MGRPPSPEGFLSALDEWRVRLLTVTWGTGGAAGEARLLALAVGADAAAGPDRLKRLRAAAQTLRLAMVEVREGPARPDALDAWIARHLLRPGPDLLVGEEQRRATLARQRDARRRQAHAGRGLRSARVEMPEESWRRLEAVRDALEATGAGRVTLGAALGQIIEACGPRAVRALQKPVQPAPVPKQEDLFGAPAAPGNPSTR